MEISPITSLPLLKSLGGSINDVPHLSLCILQLFGQLLIEVLKHGTLPPQVLNVLTHAAVHCKLLVEVYHGLHKQKLHHGLHHKKCTTRFQLNKQCLHACCSSQPLEVNHGLYNTRPLQCHDLPLGIKHQMINKYEAIVLKICHETEYQLDQGCICGQIQDVFLFIFFRGY